MCGAANILHGAAVILRSMVSILSIVLTFFMPNTNFLKFFEGSWAFQGEKYRWSEPKVIIITI